MKETHHRIVAARPLNPREQTEGPMYGVPIDDNNQAQPGIQAANES